jgi:hypothetical protein
MRLAAFAEIAKLYEKETIQNPIPFTYEAVVRCRTCLHMLSGDGQWFFQGAIPESFLEEVQKDVEMAGYREELKDNEIRLIAERRYAIFLLQRDRFSFNWDIPSGRQIQRVRLGNSSCYFDERSKATRDYNFMITIPGLTPPMILRYRNWHSSRSADLTKYEGAWRGGLKGKISRDLLERQIAKHEYKSNSANTPVTYYSPQNIPLIEQQNPSMQTLPFAVNVALSNLCTANTSESPGNDWGDLTSKGKDKRSLFLESFLREHTSYLELEEVQRRIEYAIAQEGFTVDMATCSFLAKKAQENKQYKTAAFLLSLNPKNIEEAKIQFTRRLKDKLTSFTEKKFFATYLLKGLIECNQWSEEDWKLALQAFGCIESCSIESGNPELQAKISFHIKTKFLPSLQGLNSLQRNKIFSSLIKYSQPDDEWVLENGNWKLQNSSTFFDTNLAIIIENGSTGPLPDMIYLHPDYKMLFGPMQQTATASMENGKTYYSFLDYQIEVQENGISIQKKINEKMCTWRKLSSVKNQDPRMQLLETKGVWLYPETKRDKGWLYNTREGVIFLGNETLKASFIEQRDGNLLLRSITDQKGYTLSLPNQEFGLLGFTSLESTFVFTNYRNKLQKALFTDINQKLERTDKGFSLMDGKKLNSNVALSKEDQAIGFAVATANLPQYGMVASNDQNLQLKLFFPKKRDGKRALTLDIEKPRFPGAPPKVTGSTMAFLFLSEQAASEGHFEKAASLLEKAKYSGFSQEEKVDFEYFTQALEAFEPKSIAAKAWKCKCLILVLQLQKEKMGMPIFDPKNPIFSLAKVHEAVHLHNAIQEAFKDAKKGARKENRLRGALALSTKETQALKRLADCSVSDLASQPKTAPATKSTTPVQKSINNLGSVMNAVTLLQSAVGKQPWLALDFLEKPDPKKSLLKLPIYPTPSMLIQGFTSFAKEIALAGENNEQLLKLQSHLKSLHTEGMDPENRDIVNSIITCLLHIACLPGPEKATIAKKLDFVKPTPSPKTDAQKNQSWINKIRAIPQKVISIPQKIAQEYADEYQHRLVTLIDCFASANPATLSADEAKQADSASELLESKIETTQALSSEEKLRWTGALRKVKIEDQQELFAFLKASLELRENLASDHWINAIKSSIETETLSDETETLSDKTKTLSDETDLSETFIGKMLSNPAQQAPIILSLPSGTDAIKSLIHAQEMEFVKDAHIKNKLGTIENDPLANAELQRIYDTKLSDRTDYTIKDQSAFNQMCAKTKKMLHAYVCEQISELGEKHDDYRGVISFERMEKLLSKFIVENRPDLDQILTNILSALIVMQQLDKGLPEAIIASLHMARLNGLTPTQARAVLVGEYRSGNVSRSFQPGLIQKLTNFGNIAVLSPPGSGKSTTILPAAAQLVAREKGKFPIILLTDELLHLGKEGFDITTKSLFEQAAYVFTFDRNTPKDAIFLAQEVEQIYQAKKQKSYVVTSVSNLAALENELILQMEEREQLIKSIEELSEKLKKIQASTQMSSENAAQIESLQKEIESLIKQRDSYSEQIGWLKKMWGLLHDKDVQFLADEIDEIYRPNIDYNYALGKVPDQVPQGIQKACNTVMKTLMLESAEKPEALRKLSSAISSGDQSKLSPQERGQAILELAKLISTTTFGKDYSEALTKSSVEVPAEVKESEEFACLRRFLSVTAKNMPLFPGSQYGPTKNGIAIVPKKKGLESPGTRFSDPYELTFLHYLYYTARIPEENLLTGFWIEKENEWRQKSPEEPWVELYNTWNKDIRALPSSDRYKMLNKELQKPSSIALRLELVEKEIVAKKITLFPKQIRSNAHEILLGADVCGTSGTINSDALGSSFTKDKSLDERIVMKQTLGMIDLDAKLSHSTIQDFDAFLIEKAKDKKTCGIIDQAGLQKERSSLEIATLLRDGCKGKRQILFIHPLYRNKWMWNPGEDTPRPFAGKTHPNCLCYYGEADSRGTDWQLPNKEFALIVGSTCGDDDFIQAYYRARKAGKGQKVRLFVEKDVMTSDSTNADLIKRIIAQGAKERAPCNLKAAIRNLKAIHGHAMRKHLFDPNNKDDADIFPRYKDHLIIRNQPENWKKELDTSSSENTKTILEKFASQENGQCNTLALDEAKKAEVVQELDTFAKAIENMTGLPEEICVKDISSGNTETVQEQVEVTEQVEEAVQEQVNEEASSFSIDKKLTRLDTYTSSWNHCFIGVLHINRMWFDYTSGTSSANSTLCHHSSAMPRSRERYCFDFESASTQLTSLKKQGVKQGLGGFVWLASHLFPENKDGDWNFTLLDSLDAKQDRGYLDAKQDPRYQFLIKPLSDEASKENSIPFLAVNAEGYDAEAYLKSIKSFWKPFIEAKIISGCWSFSQNEEKTALQEYLKEVQKAKEFPQIIQSAVFFRLGDQVKETPEEFWKSDLGQAILELDPTLRPM